jgi:hypothetical protein
LRSRRLDAKRGGDKTYKSAMKIITRTLMKIHEMNTPQNMGKRERVGEEGLH